MSAVRIMAASLDQQLQEYGIFSLTRDDCEAIVQSMFERVVRLARSLRDRGGQR